MAFIFSNPSLGLNEEFRSAILIIAYITRYIEYSYPGNVKLPGAEAWFKTNLSVPMVP